MPIAPKLTLSTVMYVIEDQFSYFPTKTFVVGSKNNRLIETVLFNTQTNVLTVFVSNAYCTQTHSAL